MRRAAVLSLLAVSVVALAACGGAQATKTGASGAQPAPAATKAAAAAALSGPKELTGSVAETMNSGGYTYARLQAGGKEDVWVAAREFATKPGDQLTVTLDMPMENFESKTLKRTFPLIYFVAGVTRDGQRLDAPASPGGAPPLMASHGSGSATPASMTVDPVAPPAGGMSVADVWAKRTSLAGRQVTVRGKVVKVNNGIMGRNWIHLQDGSGSANDKTNDLTVTTAEDVTVGQVVTFSGILAVDKDFTAGYAYGAIVEQAKLIK